MDKIVENLTTLYRTMLLVAAITFTTAVYYEPDVYRFSIGLARVELTDRIYQQFLGDIQEDATALYRAELLAAMREQPDRMKVIIAKARFSPAVVIWPSAQRQPQDIKLYSPDLPLALIYDMAANRKVDMNYILVTLDPTQLASYLSAVRQAPNWRAILDGDDIAVSVDSGSAPGQCSVWFRSSKWDGHNRSDLRTHLQCTAPRYRNISALQQTFLQEMGDIWNTPLRLPPELVQLPLKIAHDRFVALAAAETPQERIEVLGAKLGIAAILNVGPLILAVLLLMMLGQMRVISYTPADKPADGAAWFGQFLGWPAVTTFSILVLLPTLTTAQALAATFQPVPRTEALSRWSLTSLWEEKLFLMGGLIVFILSAWLFVSNVMSALAWKRCLVPPPTVAVQTKSRRPPAGLPPR